MFSSVELSLRSFSMCLYCEKLRSTSTESMCVCVCVCVLLLISDTTRFGAMVKQRVERSYYDILNLCGDFRKTS